MDTLNALDAIRIKHPTPPAAGSEKEKEAIDNFRRFFTTFSVDRIETLLGKTYAEDVYFCDTLKTIQGIKPLMHYLCESAEAVEACTVEVLDISRNDHNEHLVRWKMMIRFRKFKKGQDTWTVGMSHLRYNADGFIVYHQDYWNSTDGLFRHIPVLGFMIEKVLARV
jgi:hypothetical protein